MNSRIFAFILSVALAVSSIPIDMVLADTVVTTQEENADTAILFTLGGKASYVNNGKGGQAIKINASWTSTSSDSFAGLNSSAVFKDSSIFKKNAFTLYADVYRQVISTDNNAQNSTNQGKNVAFYVGEADNYFKICLSNGGSLRYKNKDGNETIVAFTGETTEENKWNALAISYEEVNGVGEVAVYIEGKKVLESTSVGFSLSGLSDIKAALGGGYGTGFMGRGLYDNIRIENVAISAEEIEVAERYTPYNTFSGAAEGILCSGDVNVNEWLDTNGEHIQAHGGQVQWLDTLDLDKDGSAEGGWIWYGEDKSRNGKPIDGIHCYTSPDLYNWTDEGIVLATHDVLPDKLNAAGTYCEANTEGLEQLKAWAEMTEPTEDIAQADIDMAKDFIAAYKTADGYDEENLKKAFKYLYSGYCIAERPKMLYNESTKQYVLVYHVDGPSDENIIKYLQNGTFPSRYSRAMMGFAVSDTPYGPFKLVNAQRMNYKTGGDYAENTGMARDMGVFIDDTDVNKDGVKDAYAMYSSENNLYIYISLLNSDYTGPATEGSKDTLILEDGTVIQTFQDRALGSSTWREAPAMFKYNGYYYMITSDCTGWVANKGGYHRAENIFGPWEAMGDPCEGGSADTFGSQPTAVIPVDAERGKFIYMGDRWSYTITDASKGHNGTDSAHWDSGYVWLPIEINDDNTITLPKAIDWNLSALNRTVINTKMPELISTVNDLPTEIEVVNDEGTFKSKVEWKADKLENFVMNKITGTLTDLNNQNVSVNVRVAPKNIVYFANCGGVDVVERNKYISNESILLNKTVADQAYSIENKWGYVGENTAIRENAVNTLAETLRYVNDSANRDLVYQFDGLKTGSHSVYLGFFDPSSWYAGIRFANVTVSQGDTILATKETECGGNGSVIQVEYNDLKIVENEGLKVTVSPKNTGQGSDVQISWIAIVDNEARPQDSENSNNQNSDKQEQDNQNTGNQNPNDGSLKIPSEKVIINTKKICIVKGKTANIKAVMSPLNTTDTLTWSSSKESVATVENGKIKAKKTGKTNITVTTTSGKSVVCKVTVVKKSKNAKSVKLNKKKLSMKAGEEIFLTATLKPSTATDTIKWKSSNKKIVSVDKYGYISAKKKGKATITATIKNGKKVSCKITVK